MADNIALEKARAQMRTAQVSAPEEMPDIPEEQMQTTAPRPISSGHQVASQPVERPETGSDALNGGEVTVMDFMQATRAVQFVDQLWPSKGKVIKVKKFSKGELDKISAPFFQKTLKLDLTQFGGNQGNNVPMNFDLSMALFSEMEKVMVELGLSFYKDSRGEPVINRNYIDNFMSSEDFQELSTIVQRVNPNALMTSVRQQERVNETKNS